MSKIPARYKIFCMVQGKALNFSSKLIMVEVQLGLERDKNHKLLQTIAELKPGQLQDKVHTSNSSCDIWSSFNHTILYPLVLGPFYVYLKGG